MFPPQRCSLLLLAALAAVAPDASCQDAPAPTEANITVHADTPVATIPGPAFGLNTAVWNPFMADPSMPGLYRAAGITALRYPGGSTSDGYHWQTHSATAHSSHYVNPKNSFDTFMKVARQSGAQPIITVNYGSNPEGTDGADPAEAAAWVDYANNTKKYGVKYWEIGNEIYGNKQYGNGWETDLHADQSPTAYGNNVVLFSQAMKAKDPSVKIGAVLVTPGSWPDGKTPDWNTTVLTACGSAIDFVIIHPYAQEPGHENDPGLLAAPARYARMMDRLHALITRSCGTNAPSVQIWVTELNSVSSKPGKQTVSVVNALFLADAYATWLENGVVSVDWWASHNGMVKDSNNGPDLYGSETYGDYGILSSGRGPEPAAQTPFPSYYGFQMLSKLGKPGDLFVRAESDRPLLAAHAVWQAGGSLALLLVNKDSVNPCVANVRISGYKPIVSSQDYFYGPTSGAGGVSSTSATVSGGFQRTLPPYSLTTVVMQPETVTPSPSPSPTPAPTPNAAPTAN